MLQIDVAHDHESHLSRAIEAGGRAPGILRSPIDAPAQSTISTASAQLKPLMFEAELQFDMCAWSKA